MNISILGVIPWRELAQSGAANSKLYVVSTMMERVYGHGAVSIHSGGRVSLYRDEHQHSRGHPVAGTGAIGSGEQQVVRGLDHDGARVRARRRFGDFGAGDVDCIRVGVFADAGVLASAVCGGARWGLFSGLRARASCTSVPLCVGAGAGGSGGPGLLPAAFRLVFVAESGTDR